MCQVAAPGAATQLIDEETLFQLIQLNLFCRKPWHLLPILQVCLHIPAPDNVQKVVICMGPEP